jgi:hypothetical protein
MSASLIRFALIHPGSAAHPDQPRVLHFNVEGATVSASRAHNTVHLLVLDTRRMNTPCLKAAFEETNRLRITPGFKHGVLVCDVPLLPVVRSAMRVGLRDIIHEPLTARQLVQLLRAATPGNRTCSHQIAALGAIVRTLAAADGPASPSARLARREYALAQRSEQLEHAETRIALQRAALEDREQKLRAGTRRLERDFAALQSDSDLARPKPAPAAATPSATPFTATPFTASPFATDLQAIARQLAERAHALDIREQMLKEMEGLLLAQVAAPAGQQAVGW